MQKSLFLFLMSISPFSLAAQNEHKFGLISESLEDEDYDYDNLKNSIKEHQADGDKRIPVIILDNNGRPRVHWMYPDPVADSVDLQNKTKPQKQEKTD